MTSISTFPTSSATTQEKSRGDQRTDEPALAPPPRPIVVGVDGSEAGWLALDWATQEALHAGRPLHIVNGMEAVQVPASPMTTVPSLWDDTERVVRLARDEVVRRDPHPVLTVTHTAEPASVALVRASQTAALVVVGTHRHFAASAALLGSTAVSVVAGSATPVVVVHERPATPSPAPVFVGVDGTDASVAAVDVAARWAADHGTTLVAVQSWNGEVPLHWVRSPEPIREETRRAASREHLADLTQALEPARRAYPGLEIHARVPVASPVDALVAVSAEAEVVVVGGRGLGAARGLLLGSVSEAVLQRAHCPVIVVPDRR